MPRRHYLSEITSILAICSVFGMVMVASCSIGKKNQKQEDLRIEKQQDKIVFLVFNMKHDSLQQQNIIKLIHQTVVDGTLKQNSDELPHSENYLTINLINSASDTVRTYADHPLIKRVEYEEGNELVSKIIKLNEADFFVRVHIKGNNQRIIVSEHLESGKEHILLNTKSE